MVSAEMANRIKALAREVGYIDCGITTAEPFDRFATALRERMDRFPEAGPLYEEMRQRVDPRQTAPWARSIVVCVRRYGKYRLPPGLTRPIGKK